ncbi:hypothetical protein SADO_06362 [Salinisphaera dokdonensis CL-ES53]|uniref:Uncharacterized protein n=1 Tax=Salinisphaera dokdonensis CL-ES53 TaxID=1304272 RepID=A0ABV2AYZ7_9GAMM
MPNISQQTSLPLPVPRSRRYEIVQPEPGRVTRHPAYDAFDQNWLAVGAWPPLPLASHLGDAGIEFAIGPLPIAVVAGSRYRIISGLRTWISARHARVLIPVVVVRGVSAAQCRAAAAWDIARAMGIQRGSDSACHAIKACTQLRRDHPELASLIPRKNLLCEWYGLTPEQVRPAQPEERRESLDPETRRMDLGVADDDA